MNAASRQTVLLLALPALLVVAAYILFVAPEALRDLGAAEAELEAVRRGVPGPGAVETESARVAALEHELAALRTDEGGAASVSTDVTLLRAAAGAEITKLLARHNLRLLDELSSGTTRLPPALGHSAGEAPGDRERLRTVRFQGRFLDVLAAVEAIPRTGDVVLPLRLTMTSDADGLADPTWSLVLWM